MLPDLDWPRIRAALALQRWQEAYAALPPCRGKDDAAWQEAAAIIEAAKAAALAALTAKWREGHTP